MSVPGWATLKSALFLDTELVYFSNCSSWKIGTAYHIASTPWLPMTCDATNEGISSQGIDRIFPEWSCPASTKLPKCSAQCIFLIAVISRCSKTIETTAVLTFQITDTSSYGSIIGQQVKIQRLWSPGNSSTWCSMSSAGIFQKFCYSARQLIRIRTKSVGKDSFDNKSNLDLV